MSIDTIPCCFLFMTKFNTYLNSIDTYFWKQLFLQKGKLQNYQKGETFIFEGETNRKVGFILNEYFKHTVNDIDGNEHITGFAFKDSFIGDYFSAVKNNPAMTNIIAVKESTVLICDSETVANQFANDNNLHISIIESLFQQIYTIYLNSHKQSPKERYIDIIKRCPEILNDITLKELASFLQITPTYLSKIRKENSCKSSK